MGLSAIPQLLGVRRVAAFGFKVNLLLVLYFFEVSEHRIQIVKYSCILVFFTVETLVLDTLVSGQLS